MGVASVVRQTEVSAVGGAEAVAGLESLGIVFARVDGMEQTQQACGRLRAANASPGSPIAMAMSCPDHGDVQVVDDEAQHMMPRCAGTVARVASASSE
jgi:hypothetical protein